ncbi:endonuclease YncB(thermonuclease family) [Altererythrobacter atlanticus]|nr:endonuclease YncB(thermonuclease family) [Croceibacterium atlanticum]
MIALPLATFTVVFLWDAPLPSRAHVPMDRDSASFEPCSGTVRTTCVVDGDTFWYRGKKIRIADINTPETSQPDCAREARLGAQATERLTQLLNRGPFTLETAGNDRDRYGRLLRVVTREGRSLGDILVEEGLAEPWKGYRGDWC